MKKMSMRFKSSLCLVLAFGMILGNVVTVSAETPDRGFGDQVAITDEYKNTETTGGDTGTRVKEAETAGSYADTANGYAGAANTAAEAAQAAAGDAETNLAAEKTALDEAETAVSEAEAKLNEALGRKTDEDKAVSTANEEEQKELAAKSDANKAAQDAAGYVDTVSGAAATLELMKENYDNAAKVTQNAIDAATAAVNASVAAVEADIAADAASAAAIRSDALDKLTDVLNADGQARIDACSEVAILAEQIGEVAQKATDELQQAKDAKAKAIEEYNKYAAQMGLPSWDVVSGDALSGNFAGITTGKIEDLASNAYNNYKNNNITGAEVSLASITAKIDAASSAYDNAVSKHAIAVSEAAAALEDVQNAIRDAEDKLGTANGKLSAAEAAKIEALKKAAEACSKAAEAIEDARLASNNAAVAVVKANDAINYYLDIAQADLDAKNAQVNAKEAERAAAESNAKNKQNACDSKEDSIRKDVKSEYDAECAKLQKPIDDAQSDINSLYSKISEAQAKIDEAKAVKKAADEAIAAANAKKQEYYDKRGLKVWKYTEELLELDGEIAELKLKKAGQDGIITAQGTVIAGLYVAVGEKETEKAGAKGVLETYKSINNESAREKETQKRLKKTNEYKDAVNANNALEARANEKRSLEAEAVQLTDIRDAALKAVNEANAKYNNDISKAQERLSGEIADAIRKASDGINQSEYDNALYDWVVTGEWTKNQKFLDVLVSTVGNIKTSDRIITALYEAYSVDHSNFFKKIIKIGDIDDVIDAYLDMYRADLKKAEEDKADTLARIAKDIAENASAAAVNATNALNNVTVRANSASAEAVNVLTVSNGAITADINDIREMLDTVSGDAISSAAIMKAVDDHYAGEIKEAKQAVEDQKTRLQKIKDDVKDVNLTPVDFLALLNAIADAETKVANAELAVAQIEADKAAVESYLLYAEGYTSYVPGGDQSKAERASAEYAKDASGNAVTVSLNAPVDPVDIGARITAAGSFTNVTNGTTVVVTEQMYKRFVTAIVEHEKDPAVGIADAAGNGVDLTTSPAAMSLPYVYWELDANGELTGRYYESTVGMPSGTYFMGYLMERTVGDDLSAKGLKLEGVLATWTAPTYYYYSGGEITLSSEKKAEEPAKKIEEELEIEPEEGTPQGSADIDDADEELELDEDGTALGIAQTGTVTTFIFYGIAAVLIALSIVFRKLSAKEN